MEYKYALVITYSFDPNVPILLFKDEDAAKKYLKESFERELKEDLENWPTEYELADDGQYACLINHFKDRNDITKWRISSNITDFSDISPKGQKI